MRMHAIGAVVLVLTAGADAGTTRYVDASCGSDAWTGTSPVCVAPNGPKATIQAGLNAAGNGDEVVVAPGVYPERIDFEGKAIHLRSEGGAGVTVLDGEHTRRLLYCVSGEGPDTIVEGFTMRRGHASQGGAMVLGGVSPTIVDCVFTENYAEVGSVARVDGGAPIFRGCTFFGNDVLAGGGIASFESSMSVIACDFVANDGGAISALVVVNGGSVTNCTFFENNNENLGATDSGDGVNWVNCAWSRNTSNTPAPASMILSDAAAFINCTFTGDNGAGIEASGGVGTLHNCIVWDNDLGNLAGSSFIVSHSDIGGGWPGDGNIDADPLFAVPGLDNLRLTFGSPCLDAGSNTLLPPDTADLDDDGDTSEPLPIDLAGNPRVADGTVDMGAYEGLIAAQAPADGTTNLDEGDSVALVPDGNDFDPVSAAAALVISESATENASAVLTQYDDDMHPDAGGYTEIGAILDLVTSLDAGGYKAAQFLPINALSLGGITPEQLNVTWYDAKADAWALAVSYNTSPSPGFQGPVGNRVVVTDGGPFGTTLDMGDYGVWWDPDLQQGFAWANVDREGEFAVGASLCPADCRQTPDGIVDTADMLALLGAWGLDSGGPCDLDFDGVIGEIDFLMLLGVWGPCVEAQPVSASSTDLQTLVTQAAGLTPTRPLDVNGDGMLSRADYHEILRAWGSADTSADLDADGTVDARDAALLLSRFK